MSVGPPGDSTRWAVECGLLTVSQAARPEARADAQGERLLAWLGTLPPADRTAWLAARRASLAEARNRIADGSLTPGQAAAALQQQVDEPGPPCPSFASLIAARGWADDAGAAATLVSAPARPPADPSSATIVEAPVDQADTRPGKAAVPVRRAPEPAPDGRPFGKYVLERELGRGGCGTVYRAWQTDLARTVAIKTLSTPDGKPEDVARFQQEARLAARLRHPHIATVYEVGVVDGQHYIAMEYIDGPTLKEAVLARTLDLDAVLRRVCDVARALEYAHGEGVIHRDIKPENIMLASDRTPRIMDFGLARQIADRTQITVSGTILGTPAYMSPEQANGETHGLDARTDVYSLGAVLYYSLAGKPPFAGSSLIETVYQVIERDPPPLSKLRPDLPRDAVVIAETAMEKDRERRYHTAGALANDIDRFLAGEAILARPSSWTHRFRRRVRKHPGSVAVACVAAVALTLGWQASDRRARRLAAESESREATARALAEEKRLREVASALFDQARFHRGKEALSLLDKALDADPRHVESLFLRAQLRKAEKDYPGARADLDTLLAVAPGDVTATLMRAVLLDQVFGEQDAAMAEYDRLVGMKVQPEVGLNARGRARMMRGDLAGAIADFDEAIRVNPNYGDARINRGSALSRVGRLREALRDLRHIAQLEPDNSAVYCHLAYVHHQTTEYLQAIACADQAIQRNPLYAEAWLQRGRSLAELGRQVEAEEACRKASELRPGDAGPLVTLGFVQKEMGKLQEAKATLQRALEKNPNDSGAHNNLGLVYQEEERNEESLAELTRALELAPKDPVVLRNRARTLVHLKRYAEAVADCDAALAIHSWYPAAHLTRGWALFWLRKMGSAVRHYEKFLEMAPNDRFRLEAETGIRTAVAMLAAGGRPWVPATDHLKAAETALAAGEVERARESAAAAEKANPLLWTPHLLLCRIAVRARDFAAARDGLRRARDAGFPFVAAFLQTPEMDAAREDPQLATMASE